MAEFNALVLHETDGKVAATVEKIAEDRLPPGEVTVAVEYSTLNYKDGMILQGVGRLVRSYPHVPGIDFAGTVERSESPDFAPGDAVILTLGGLRRKGARSSLLLGAPTRGAQRRASYGDRDRRFYGNARRDCA
jgi:NADPH:quinone reductase-like Zn-dependent oxidoreductase